MLNFIVDNEKCVQCNQCVTDCPASIIRFESGVPAIAPSREDRCLKCMHCLAVCPTAAVSILNVTPEDCLPLKGNMPSDHQLETLMKGRRSVRRFKQENVEKDLIDRLITLSANAPTAKNAMQLQFSVVDDLDVMRKISKHTYKLVAEAVADHRVPEEMSHFRALSRAYAEGFDIVFRKAPHMLVVSSPTTGSSPMIDVGIALTHFDLAATNAGLGSLWCGFAMQAFTHFVPEYKEILGIPEDHNAAYSIMFGKPAVKYYRAVDRRFQAIHRVKF
ncbi:nitroreductase family protein [Halodesulfovibrio marinisediminis]|uniref:Nitroreductase n=1 Tax=Halodesulfovibrio marinisediminis DSM 17456 TaxID=1121457 RepID=A0A1N6F9C6_9BACT|nr:nitroreductase family protein [Halodesulfovibrio marinisediminis]SIN91892.1 Nitroreductase [Halodesulfovibrio marinisediminis DSM 17456]